MAVLNTGLSKVVATLLQILRLNVSLHDALHCAITPLTSLLCPDMYAV